MKKRKIYEISVIDKTYSKTISDETKFYTSDTALELGFELKETEYNFDSAEIVLLNVDDRSLATRPVSKVDNDFVYEIDDDITTHYGDWRGQLMLVEKGEVHVSSPIKFRIENDLYCNKPLEITEVVSWVSLKRYADGLIDELKQAVLDVDGIEDTFNANETERQNTFETNESERNATFNTNETTRQENEDARIEAEKQREGTVKKIENRQTFVENQFNSIQQELTDKDPISAPEIIAARGGEPTLSDRLDKEQQNVTAQLAQNEDRMNGVMINAMYPPIPFRRITSDANYYDEANFKYYKNEAMTIPATDNTGVVQALVNFLHEKGGGTLLIPDGKYVFRSTVAWKSKVSLVGASKTGTRLYSEGVQFSLIRGTTGNSDGSSESDPSVWFDDCKFTDFLIDNKGLSFPDKTVDGKALFILYMRRAVFRDLILLNTLGTALGCDFLVDTVIDSVFTYKAGRSSYPTGHGGNSGIGIGTSALTEEPIVVTNCFTYNSGNYGVFVETQNNPSGVKAKYAKVVNCHSQGNKLGFGNKGSGGTQFIGCTAVDNRLHGFHLTQGTSGDQLLGCISERNGGDGVRIERDYVGDLDISNVWANNNSGAGIRVFHNDTILKNVRILDSKTHRNGSSGVWIGGNAKNIVIKGINSVNNGQDSSVVAGYRRGILVGGVNDIVSILDNTVFDDQATKTQVAGIDVSKDTTNYILDGNNVTGYASNSAYLADLSKGAIGTNSNLVFEKHGIATIAEGQQTVDVIHGLGKIPTAINISPVQYAGIPVPIWIVRSDGNMIRVRKELATGTVDFYWEVRVD